jgi:hypothetical protein
VFIELAEYLRCPVDHPEAHCVLAADVMDGRDVVQGIVGCPVCRNEYAIADRIARFGEPPSIQPHGPLPEPALLQALVGITTPGGYLVLIGSAAARARELAELIEGVHLVAVNAESSVRGPGASLLVATASVPLRTAMARGVVVSEEAAMAPWLAESARVLLPGLRMVVVADSVEVPGVEPLAAERGVWVGQRIGDRR